MNVRKFFFLVLIFLPFFAVGQGIPGPGPGPQEIYQLSGMIISETSESAVPYVTVRVNNTRRGVVSNSEGFYSIPVTEYDTLYFNHVGFHPTKFVIRDYLRTYSVNSQYIYAVNYMREDTLTLAPVVIFPYNTPEEIKTAVVNMDILENSPESFAKANLDPTVMDAIIKTLPVDGDERLMVGRQMYYDYYQNKNLVPTAGLNPLAAMRLLQYVVEKSKRRKDKDLNYWE
ncbi:MAG: carboxypeptidase-like regulatory domain-containing protein [Bacteroidota bacterium]